MDEIKKARICPGFFLLSAGRETGNLVNEVKTDEKFGITSPFR